MIHEEIASFAAALPSSGALAGLDFGEKTIGIAVSDGLRSVATPLETICLLYTSPSPRDS